jgi:hypothetical protein
MTDLITTEDQLEPTPAAPGRRRFFMTAGVAGAGLLLAACGDDDSADTTPGTTNDDTDTTEPADDGGSGDVAIATFAAGLELLAANTYKAALDAAGTGALGTVPPAVAEFATVVMGHHQEASDALAAAAGGITPTVPADIESAVNAEFAKVTDVTGLARLALTLELQAAATYLEVIPQLTTPAAINLAGSILPIERQHAAVLHFVLGEYPVPDTFAGTDDSLAP